MAAKIKKGDTVIVRTGKDRGKTGEVLKVLVSEQRVLVQGINVAKRHEKPSMRSQGGISNKELPIHISNVALADPKDGKAIRVGFKTLDDGTKTRFAKRSGEVVNA